LAIFAYLKQKSMSKVKAVLFDFDGTLFNTAPGILITIRETFKKMGYPVPEDDKIKATIGLPLVQVFRILGPFDEQKAVEGAATYRELFPIFEISNVFVFPGVKETLDKLSSLGIRMAICTSRDFSSLHRILVNHQMWSYFETAVTIDDGLKPKPAPDPVLALLSKMDLGKEDVLVVGDTTFDIGMGNNAGCKTCAVTYGNHSAAKLSEANPTYTIDDFGELLSLFDDQK